MRIARALALAGIDSRRKCEEHIRNGEVTVNGRTVLDLGRQVDPEKDAIAFRGRLLLIQEAVYYLFFKPEGCVTTSQDAHASKTVFDLLPSKLVRGAHNPKAGRTRVFPVGRLDKDSSGLLLFTNDGNLANHLMHPRYGVERWYEVRLDRPLASKDQLHLLKGVRLSDGWARAEKVHSLSRKVLRLMLREGRNREVRRIFEALGYEVERLCRIGFGPLRLERLVPGEGRYLSKKEIADLKAGAGFPRVSV